MEIKEKIIVYFRMNCIDIDIIDIIEGLQVTTYKIKVENLKITTLNKIKKMIEPLQLYLKINNINLNIENDKGFINIEIPNKERKTLEYKDITDYTLTEKNGLYFNLRRRF